MINKQNFMGPASNIFIAHEAGLSCPAEHRYTYKSVDRRRTTKGSVCVL